MKPRLPASFAALICLWSSAFASGLDATVSTAAGLAVQDAVVSIEPASGQNPRSRPGKTVTIEQRDREFFPYVTVIQSGTLVEFPNRDPVKHHVYSFSSPRQFEIKLYGGKPAQPVLFDKPGEVAIGCNIHDWMEAYVLVVNSPYFAKTDSQGKARIRNVPAGDYQLKLWHPRQKADAGIRQITIGSSPARLNLTTDISPRISKPKPPVDQEKY